MSKIGAARRLRRARQAALKEINSINEGLCFMTDTDPLTLNDYLQKFNKLKQEVMGELLFDNVPVRLT